MGSNKIATAEIFDSSQGQEQFHQVISSELLFVPLTFPTTEPAGSYNLFPLYSNETDSGFADQYCETTESQRNRKRSLVILLLPP